MEPSGRRNPRHRSRLPGREMARLGTVARSAHRDYADIWWRWSLRDDGSAWYRLARVWYWRPVPHAPGRREPPLWRLVAHLEPPGIADQAAAAELLARVARGHGHYPAGPELLARPARERVPAAWRPMPRRGRGGRLARALRLAFRQVTEAEMARNRARYLARKQQKDRARQHRRPPP